MLLIILPDMGNTAMSSFYMLHVVVKLFRSFMLSMLTDNLQFQLIRVEMFYYFVYIHLYIEGKIKSTFTCSPISGTLYYIHVITSYMYIFTCLYIMYILSLVILILYMYV
jgi:hypothetical protein